MSCFEEEKFDKVSHLPPVHRRFLILSQTFAKSLWNYENSTFSHQTFRVPEVLVVIVFVFT